MVAKCHFPVLLVNQHFALQNYVSKIMSLIYDLFKLQHIPNVL
jgi:hypothetical protein